MDKLILATLAAYGLCHILMYGTIFNIPRAKLTKIKFFKELLSCSLCIGFWVGLALSTFTEYNTFVFALYSAATCYIIDRLTDKL